MTPENKMTAPSNPSTRAMLVPVSGKDPVGTFAAEVTVVVLVVEVVVSPRTEMAVVEDSLLLAWLSDTVETEAKLTIVSPALASTSTCNVMRVVAPFASEAVRVQVTRWPEAPQEN